MRPTLPNNFGDSLNFQVNSYFVHLRHASGSVSDPASLICALLVGDGGLHAVPIGHVEARQLVPNGQVDVKQLVPAGHVDARQLVPLGQVGLELVDRHVIPVGHTFGVGGQGSRQNVPLGHPVVGGGQGR